jgi:hypothetical protein
MIKVILIIAAIAAVTAILTMGWVFITTRND